ncbi:MAG TPA: aminoglycoside phosphotransferase family protein [Micromonosporaceae bacterium]|nr:aminoglycoside phosphotransferase family protein [Micromonosporaceae bacterium]
MTHADVTVPDDLRETVQRWFGEPGRQWLAELPVTAAALAERWELWLGAPYTGGTHSLVLRATTAEGTPVVLKVPFRDDENYAEAATLRCYDGDGAVRLLAYDEPTGALLLERAEPGSSLSRHPNRSAAIAIACGLLRRLRRPAPPGGDFPSAVVLARRWSAELPARQRRYRLPGAGAAVAEAAEIAADYAERSDGLPLLVNRDAHLGNVVRAQRGRWLLIDPKPVVGEAAFEGAHPVLQTVAGMAAAGEVDAATMARAITQWSIGLGVDPARVRGWALVRAVDNALWSAAVGTSPAVDLALIRALSTPIFLSGGHTSQPVDDRVSHVVAQNPEVVDRQVDRGLPRSADHPVA